MYYTLPVHPHYRCRETLGLNTQSTKSILVFWSVSVFFSLLLDPCTKIHGTILSFLAKKQVTSDAAKKLRALLLSLSSLPSLSSFSHFRKPYLPFLSASFLITTSFSLFLTFSSPCPFSPCLLLYYFLSSRRSKSWNPSYWLA